MKHYKEVLTEEAVNFISELVRTFRDQREKVLENRRSQQYYFNCGMLPDFLPETAGTRLSAWQVAPIPQDLLDRRVEITGPAERKMIINALNSGANVFMADLEDSNSPTWDNVMQGQINLMDAVRRTISFTNEAGKEYKLNDKTAVLMVRPRGWHMIEKHFKVDGQPVSASLFDFGLYFYHNAKELMRRGSGPYFYLPKMEHYLEARLWNDVFRFSQEWLGIPNSTIRATCLIETITAAFQMDEILYELMDHSAGANAGRWDYIFSYIKKLAYHSDRILPDRSQVTMDKAFLDAYVRLLIYTCHRRGIHAMGGMAAQIPIKNDSTANETAMEKVKADKLREVLNGHDGTWVAHPGLVSVAREVFDAHMPKTNQIIMPNDYNSGIKQQDLLKVHEGTITEDGLRHNIRVGIQYLESWLRGVGCVPIYNLMEDAATAELSRAQVWQWLHHHVEVDGVKLTPDRFDKIALEELCRVEREADVAWQVGKFNRAYKLFMELSTSMSFKDFLTLAAYDSLEK